MEVNDVFSAAPKSVMDVLCEPNVGCYIPAYQRDYDWGVGHIQRLFEDSTHGLKLLVEQQDAITFLGTLILIHDTRYTTVEPQVRGDLPARVYLVIDGQQRLTTLLLMSAILHEEIKRRGQDFSGSQNPAENWLFNQTVELDAMLQQCFRIDMFRGQGVHQFYPRMIRSYLDSWSRQPSQANYLSPIARYLHSYVSHIAARSTTVHRYEPPDHAPQDVRNLHTLLKRNLGAIRTQTRQVADGNNPDLEMPDLRELCDRSELQRILFTTDLEDSVKAILRSDNDAFHELFRLVIFTKFLLGRVCVTEVTVKTESYAFDMFEALNTTGEPLTAFETFRPLESQLRRFLHTRTPCPINICGLSRLS